MKKPTDELTSNELDQFAQMGVAALLPGMRRMLELMQRAYNEQLEMLGLLQQGVGLDGESAPPSLKGGWSTDREERRQEMKRRKAKAKAKAKVKMHPRDPAHPGHDQWIARLRVSQKAAWSKKTSAEKKAHIAKMHTSKAKKQRRKMAATVAA